MSGQFTPGPWFWCGTSLMAARRDHSEHVLVTQDTPLSASDANARLIAAAPDLYEEHEVREGDLAMLLKAIEAGDPKAELLIRVGDMLRETRQVLAKARGSSPLPVNMGEKL